MYCIMKHLWCETNPVQKYERCGVTLNVISRSERSNVDLSDIFELKSACYENFL